MAIKGLWKRGETCILDICVTDEDAKAYKGRSLRTVLEVAAWVKKAKYLKTCLDQRCTFALLSHSVDGMAGHGARTFEKHITSLLAAKLGREYSKLVGFVRAKMAMAVDKANNLLLHGAWLKCTESFVKGCA